MGYQCCSYIYCPGCITCGWQSCGGGITIYSDGLCCANCCPKQT